MEELERENIELKAQLEEAQEILAANEIENAFRLKDEQKQQQEKQSSNEKVIDPFGQRSQLDPMHHS